MYLSVRIVGLNVLEIGHRRERSKHAFAEKKCLETSYFVIIEIKSVSILKSPLFKSLNSFFESREKLLTKPLNKC